MKCKRFHYLDELKKPVYIDKIKYISLEQAIEHAKKENTKEKHIHKLIAYKCNICGFYHIGRNKTVLTDKERKKSKEWFTFFKK
jgi:hypothetical protein